jgi:hypothetical protein
MRALGAEANDGEIEDELYRYPAVDPPSFRARVEEVLRRRGTGFGVV